MHSGLVNSDNKIIANYKKGSKDGTWFYIFNRDTLSILTYLDGVYDGNQVALHKNGIKASIINYNNGFRNGKASSWFENGNLNEVINYENGVYHGERLIFSEKGNLVYKLNYFQGTPVNLEVLDNDPTRYIYSGNLKDGNGDLVALGINKETNQKQIILYRSFKDSLLDGPVIRYNSNGDTSLIGNYKKGIMVGEWQFYDSFGKKDTSKFYNYSDSLIVDSTMKATKGLHLLYFTIERKPEFVGGTGELMEFLKKNVKYPSSCLENGIQGKVFVQFVINKIGKVVDVELVRGVDPYLDKEALRVVKLFPFWSPGIQSGLPVKVSYVVPINFRLL